MSPSPAGHDARRSGAPRHGRGHAGKVERASVGRIAVTDVGPALEGGRWSARAVPGEAVPVTATVFRDGHDLTGATAVLIDPSGNVRQSAAMAPLGQGLDRWRGYVTPDAAGEWAFLVEGWSDPIGSWRRDAEIKVPQGIDAESMLDAGAGLLADAAAGAELTGEEASVLRAAAAIVGDVEADHGDRLAAATSPEVLEVLRLHPLRRLVTPSDAYPLRVVRERALVGSWYEVFPRSMGAHFSPDRGWTSGTLKTCAEELDRIAAMGFDVLYLTPVHPIGTTFRKGRNNALKALPGDPGSPYAIGSPDGGHDSIHPDLGTFDDFDALAARAGDLGMEVALDLALQCSPDHPWVTQHPEWFTHRADGTIAYAENPPKKYQDIYPLNFDNDPEGIYAEIRRVVELWIDHGVTIFRVDNPHTKPLPFWERLIADVAASHPEIVFLAEAFTRPPMMHTLALVGFHQSYTYFAWRNTKDEVCDYLAELGGEWGSYMRPALWPTTHDILTPFMQAGGEPAFVLRAILAATGAPTWGIYSGYELIERVARPGSEEQIDNEKYEYRPRDFSAPVAQKMSRLLGSLNRIRRAHPSLRRLRNVTIHPTSDDATVCFSRRVDALESETGMADTVIVLVNVDPWNV
ncbi:MAG: alpha-1,4-glucan--maltose-1-phosphate maltosyltransferase, partial [Bifidobacteriaceae bacterium]|nr:alpha-1,4-glucan--maltose-1-phosphate maltosyltransferase [Bifidobacteriaceae bacterium]